MAKDKDKDKAARKSARTSAADPHIAPDGHGTHHVATLPLETPAQAAARLIDNRLPGSRPELEQLHAAARRRRATAALGSDEYRAALDDIVRIEVRIAAVERAMTPPRG